MSGIFELWCDVFNGTWEKQGDGPLLLRGASVSRLMDGGGQVTLQAVMDERSLELLRAERRVRIYAVQPSGDVYELGRGILNSVNKTWSDAGWLMTANGDDLLAELKRTIIYKSYTSPVTLGAFAEDIAGEAGWDAEVEAGLDIFIQGRIYGANVLKAFLDAVEENGLHLRFKYDQPTNNTPVISVGAFGQNQGVYITNLDTSVVNYDERGVGLIESLREDTTSQQMANSIIIQGGGEGEAAVTLAKSTRTSPYPIQTKVFVNGPTVQYLEDSDSVAEYGRIWRSLTFKNLTPPANTEAAKVATANALYDSGVAWLERNAQPQKAYSCSVVGLETRVLPGDLVHVSYRGDVVRDDGTYDPVGEIDGDFYVLACTERVSETGLTLDLQISNIDQRVRDEDTVIVEAIENIQLRSRKPQIFPYVFNDSWELPVQNGTTSTPNTLLSSKTARFVVPIDNIVSEITKFLIRFDTRRYAVQAILGVDLFSGNTRAGLFYRALESVYYPHEVTIKIDGIDRTSELGGPWGTYTTPESASLDITEYIVNAAGGLYQDHTIEFDCEAPPVIVDTLVAYATSSPPVSFGSGAFPISGGNIALSVSILGTAQAILTD